MEALIEEARQKGLWLHCSYQNLWFSPDELAKARSEGRFRWSEENRRLRDPRDELARPHEAIARAHRDVANFERRMGRA